MPGDRPMRRLRDPVRRTVRRLGWDVGAGTRRLGARTRPGAGGRTDSQRRPKQQENRDPVTLPRPRPADGSAVAPWAGVVRARRVGPHDQPRRWRTGHGAHRRQCRTSPTPSGMRAATDEDPAVVGEHDHKVFSATLEPEPRLLDQAEPASQERQLPPFGCAWSSRPPGPWPAMSRTEPCCGDSCTAWRWDRVAAVIDQQLRARARSSSRKLADLVREVVVQEAQRERVAVLAMDDARGRVAEARAQAAEQALQAGPNRAGPTCRGPGPSPRRPGRTEASRRPERLGGGWRW
jgi:hypothetical protein